MTAARFGRRERGVTLMELLVVIVIIGVLASIAVPSYRQYLLRTNRTDATAALLRIASAQEKFYLQNNRYATTAAEVTNAPPNGLGFNGTDRGYYQIALAAGPNGAAVGYIATATPVAGQAQAVDSACGTFTVNERGQRTALTSGNAVNTDLCWK